MTSKRFETGFFGVLLAFVLALFCFVLLPNLSALVLSATLALVFYPLYSRVHHLTHSGTFSALLVVLIVLVGVFIPLSLFGINAFSQSTRLYAMLSQNGGVNVEQFLRYFPFIHPDTFPLSMLIANFTEALRGGLNWVIQNLGSFFSGVASVLSTAILSLLGLFYFLKDGARLKNWALTILPLEEQYSEEIIREMRGVMSSVIKGTVVVAILQGVAAGVGFTLFHLPDPAFWGSVVILVSPIPIVGAWTIITPAILYLLLTGASLPALGLLLWSVVFVNVMYNVVAPQLMHRGNGIHPFVILLSMLGGIVLFGPIGFLIGPFVAAFFFSLLHIYPRLMLGKEG